MCVLTSMDRIINLLVRYLQVRWGYTKKFGEKFTRTTPVHFFFYNLLPIYASIIYQSKYVHLCNFHWPKVHKCLDRTWAFLSFLYRKDHWSIDHNHWLVQLIFKDETKTKTGGHMSPVSKPKTCHYQVLPATPRCLSRLLEQENSSFRSVS